jgi:hypothetical protein
MKALTVVALGVLVVLSADILRTDPIVEESLPEVSNPIVVAPLLVPRTDANGNASGIVVSSRTGARARVGIRYAPRFQAYIDDLEHNHGVRVLFMGGIRPGRCSNSSEHPCGKALDVCQLRRGVVDRRCNLPDRITLGQIAAAHGLFEGGRWCDSDYGHTQVGASVSCTPSRAVALRKAKMEPLRETQLATPVLTAAY